MEESVGTDIPTFLGRKCGMEGSQVSQRQRREKMGFSCLQVSAATLKLETWADDEWALSHQEKTPPHWRVAPIVCH